MGDYQNMVCPAYRDRWAALTDAERAAWQAGHEWGYADGESNVEADLDILREEVDELKGLLAERANATPPDDGTITDEMIEAIMAVERRRCIAEGGAFACSSVFDGLPCEWHEGYEQGLRDMRAARSDTTSWPPKGGK